ncbi:hypothetical protein ACSEV1_27280 [Pseudomonas aeruginosa]
MNARFRSAISLLVLPIVFHCHAGSSRPSIWDGSPTGKCFSKLDDYLSDEFGVNYRADENILLKRASEHESVKYYWVSDTTPAINTARTLFSIDSSGSACAILYIPLSSSDNFHFSIDGSLPKVVHSLDTPPPNHSATKVTYVLNKKSGVYSADKCELINGGSSEVIDCRDAFN